MDTRDVQQQHTRDLSESYIERTNLLDLLSNSVIIHQTLPYLPVSALLHLAATSRAFRDLLFFATPGAFRHLDLTGAKTAQFAGNNNNDIQAIDRGGEVWRNVQVDEHLTEDDFYSGPLRGIFQNLRCGRRSTNILQDVQTLVLDGLSVTAELVNDILVDPSLRVRILSLREVKNLNEQKLMQSLKYACRPTRPEATPRLKALYVFGKKETTPLLSQATTAGSNATSTTTRRHISGGTGASISANWNHKSQHALKEWIQAEGDEWYHKRGRVITKSISDRWAETMLDCREAIRFDSVLCTGPRHLNSAAFGKTPLSLSGNNNNNNNNNNTNHQLPWAVATFAVGGCASCGSAPEGFTVHGESPAEMLPLLSPVPLHSSNIKSATSPRTIGFEAQEERRSSSSFVPRCLECIRERYCFSCDQWWCESCYQVPSREELANAQHVHIVDDNSTNSLVVHEMAAFEQPKVKVRMGYCMKCNLISANKGKRKGVRYNLGNLM